MVPIKFLQGDATDPEGGGGRIICHICNDIGGWGKGFVLAISRRWQQPEAAYRQWYHDRAANDFALGAVQFVSVEPDIWVANMIGQHGIRRTDQGPPIRYEAVAQCLQRVAEKAGDFNASVHMPRIGCGLAGGEWSIIEPLLVEHLCARDISVNVYDFA